MQSAFSAKECTRNGMVLNGFPAESAFSDAAV